MLSNIAGFANIGSLILATIIAYIGVDQSRKRDTDKVYEYLEGLSNAKNHLEDKLSDLIENQTLFYFNKFSSEFSSFVNSIEYFSSKIINQKLYKTKAFKEFQGESSYSLLEIVNNLLILFEFIEERRFREYLITGSNSTSRKNLRNTFVLLKEVLTVEEFEELLKTCKEKGLY
ncbi:hypothetical protein JOC25_000005 [Solibacillus kalamii]|uniref:Phage abortive infection protein n=1 Tax=Solibacillus kalamii TaxID=1748298 RepID=A0ABX3ZIC2_9BACL|nr:hypothetical protein [Solibacillus kalamii]MBM7663549.1 hypothetical protein [Solibacillus kalamii]OUZ39185.1 hypothetical protein CBM15_10015 [Solibacillus kalamii]